MEVHPSNSGMVGWLVGAHNTNCEANFPTSARGGASLIY